MDAHQHVTTSRQLMTLWKDTVQSNSLVSYSHKPMLLCNALTLEWTNSEGGVAANE